MNITQASLFPDLDGLARSHGIRAGISLGLRSPAETLISCDETFPCPCLAISAP